MVYVKITAGCHPAPIVERNDMPYVNKPRPYRKEYQQQLDRNELPTRRKREQARDLYDKEGIDRKGKDIDGHLHQQKLYLMQFPRNMDR